MGAHGGSKGGVTPLPAVRETRIRCLCQVDPLEKEMATRSNTLA